MFADRRLIEALDDFVQETGDDEALGDWSRNAAGAEIEEFVLVDLTGGGAVGAPDVVGQNFEAGHRVRFGVVAQEKVAHLLIGVGEMRVRFDPDESAEGGPGAIVERIFVKQIARRVRRDVVLQCAGVEFLVAFGDRDSEQIAAPAFADEPAQTFEARILCAEMQIETHRRGVVIDRGRVHLQCAHVFAPVLRADVSDLRARAGNEIVHAAGESCGRSVARPEMFDHRDLGELVGDQKQMREDRGIFVAQPMENLDRQFDFDAARHEKKCSRRNQRLVQRGELGRAERSRRAT